MARGIIYVMTTVVPGLVKIGKTGVSNFESRMYQLERHGYSNVVGLKRKFAIEVDDYDDKEALRGDIFSNRRGSNTELFALDIDLVVQLLSSFEGNQVYPEPEVISKAKSFDVATKERADKANIDKIPEGHYYLSANRKGFGRVEATMKVENGAFILLKGSTCAPTGKSDYIPDGRKNASIIDNILMDDVACNSPSMAAIIALGRRANGWTLWKDKDGNPIDIYRASVMKYPLSRG
jgi:hypothetical protein